MTAESLAPLSSIARSIPNNMSETEAEPTLDQMLAAFDPKKHGGEAMAGGAVGGEAFAERTRLVG